MYMKKVGYDLFSAYFKKNDIHSAPLDDGNIKFRHANTELEDKPCHNFNVSHAKYRVPSLKL